jgi:hypothetical protein
MKQSFENAAERIVELSLCEFILTGLAKYEITVLICWQNDFVNKI